MNILVVEDEPEIAQLIELFLERAGHDVMLVNNIEDALFRTKIIIFDLILCDFCSGAIKFIHDISPVTHTIILSGAHYEHEDFPEAQHLPKPFSPGHLIDMVNKVGAL